MEEPLKEQLLKEYRKTVKAVLERRDPGAVRNDCPEHASIILEEMANYARKSFFAFTRKLASDVWNDAVLAAVKRAVDRGVDVRFVVSECLDSSKSRIPDSIRAHIYQSPEDVINETHCAEMDECAVRFEYDVDNRKAFFYASAPDVATRIRQIVNRLSMLGHPCYQ